MIAYGSVIVNLPEINPAGDACKIARTHLENVYSISEYVLLVHEHFISAGA
jgi:hypothetical protein